MGSQSSCSSPSLGHVASQDLVPSFITLDKHNGTYTKQLLRWLVKLKTCKVENTLQMITWHVSARSYCNYGNCHSVAINKQSWEHKEFIRRRKKRLRFVKCLLTYCALFFFKTHITWFWYFYPQCIKEQTEAQRKFSTVSMWLIWEIEQAELQATFDQVWDLLSFHFTIQVYENKVDLSPHGILSHDAYFASLL